MTMNRRRSLHTLALAATSLAVWPGAAAWAQPSATPLTPGGKAVRILQEGLLGALDREKGGELAGNLASLYEYCTAQLTLANARNDASMVDEVAGLVSTVAQGWNEITNAPAPAAA